MKTTIKVRMAKLEDVGELLKIYEPYVRNTVITFEYKVPSKEEFLGRMKKIMNNYPYLVAVDGDKIVGYAYASQHKERAAYQWNVETSIYVDMECRAKGIGSLLYERLFELLGKQNVHNVYACVTLPNERSEKIHRKYGFELIGRFHNTGYKQGSWHDVGWFEKHLDSGCEEPKPVIPIEDIL